MRYVALSYVWGSQAQRLTLNKANRNTLSNQGRVELGHLSRTISDAATVVEMLGERYLWVDALCIIQDDLDDLATLIPVMGQIYARSLLTIVAAASNDVGTGLQAVNSQARSVQRDLGPLKGGTFLRTCTPKPREKLSNIDSRDLWQISNGTLALGRARRRCCLADACFHGRKTLLGMSIRKLA